jgi:hypothetical protein
MLKKRRTVHTAGNPLAAGNIVKMVETRYNRHKIKGSVLTCRTNVDSLK